MSPRAWAAFAAVSVLWGMPYLFIKIAVEDGVSPGFLTWARVTVASAVMLPLAWKLGALRHLRSSLGALIALAICEVVIPFPLIAVGEQYISSTLTGILIAAVPLFVALLAWRFVPSERVRGIRLLGLVVGLMGVVALLGVDVAGQTTELIGAGCILLAAVGYAGGPLIVKRHLSHLNPVGSVAAALGIATIILLPVAAMTPPAAPLSASSIMSIVVLGLACAALAFVLFFALIGTIGAARASVITYVSPVVAVALGIVFLDERVGAGAGVGLLLILAGSWLATDGRLPAAMAVATAVRSHRARRRSQA